ncbi:MAG: hypothetical protein R3F62_16850 [Planctomycetota bacterium]
MASSANVSFLIIASKRNLLPRTRLERYAREADEQGVDLAEYLVREGVLEPDEVVPIVRARARHGRTCTGCSQITYMLPGDTPGEKACEHCGGALAAGPPTQSRARPVVEAAGAPPPPIPGMSAVVREEGLDDRTPVPNDRTPTPDDRTPIPDDRDPYPPQAGAPAWADPNPYAASEPEPAYPDGGYAPPPPNHSLWAEVGNLVLYPVRTPHSIALVCLGAVLLALVGGAARFSVGVLGVGCCGLAVMGIYVWMFLIDVTRTGISGGEEVPPFPDFDVESAVGTFVRVLSLQIACYLPVILLTCVSLTFARDAIAFLIERNYPTIGSEAHLLSGDAQRLKGQSAADALLYDLEGDRIELSGQWTILGLLGQDVGDDTVDFQDLPTGTVNHGFQIYDLDRVGRALSGKVTVLAAYADPRRRILSARWPFTIPEDERNEMHELMVEHEEELGELDDFGFGPLHNPFVTIRFANSEEAWFPAPFETERRFPQVYVLDPSGKIVRQYDTGVYDQKLYADVLSLMAGGDGDAWPTSLPGHVYVTPGETPQGSSSSFVLLLGIMGLAALFGLVYFPMAYLLMVLHDSPASPWLYPLAFRSMLAAPGDYAALLVIGVGILVLSWVAQIFLGVLFASAPWFLQLLLVQAPGNFLAFYSQVALCYAAGRFYYLNQDRLAGL